MKTSEGGDVNDERVEILGQQEVLHIRLDPCHLGIGDVRGSRAVPGARRTEFNLRRSHTDDLNGLGAEGRNITCEYPELTSIPGTHHTGTLIQIPKAHPPGTTIDQGGHLLTE